MVTATAQLTSEFYAGGSTDMVKYTITLAVPAITPNVSVTRISAAATGRVWWVTVITDHSGDFTLVSFGLALLGFMLQGIFRFAIAVLHLAFLTNARLHLAFLADVALRPGRKLR
jgi:hypothetical protein